jgi:hypothetical protein
MAKGKKTGGRDFQKGEKWTGNASGRPSIPKDQKVAFEAVKQLRSDLRFGWQHHYRELMDMTLDQVQAIVGGKLPDGTIVPSSDPTAPMLKLLVARSILYAMRSGKASEVQVHREMMCGPEPKQFELSGPGGEPLPPLSGYNQEMLAAAFATLDKIVRESECKSTLQQQPSESSPPSLPPASGTAS